MMRCLIRNMRPFWFDEYRGKVMNVSADGRPVGGFTVNYSKPRKAYGNIAYDMSAATREAYGIAENGDGIILCTSLPKGLGVNSRLWIDHSKNEPHDFVVVGVTHSLNSVSVAIRRVIVDA